MFVPGIDLSVVFGPCSGLKGVYSSCHIHNICFDFLYQDLLTDKLRWEFTPPNPCVCVMIILDSVGKHHLPGGSTVLNFVVKISRRKNDFLVEDSFRK